MKNKSKIPSTIHSLNNILSKSQFSGETNKLFDGLIIPPGFCISKIQPNSNIKILCNDESEYLDDKIYSKLIKLAEKHNTTPKNKRKKRRTKKN